MRYLDLALVALLVLLAGGLLVVLALGRRASRRRASVPAPRPEAREGPDPAARTPLEAEVLDEDELLALDTALEAVAAEHRVTLQRLLAAQLAVLDRRRVPVRAVRPTGDPPVVRVCFADGTVVRVRPVRAGDWVPLIRALAEGRAVVVESWAPDDTGGVGLVLAVPGGPRRRGTAVGLDQAD